MVGLCNYHLSHLSAQGKILILFPLGLLSEHAGLGPCFPSGSDTSGYHTIYIPPFLCHQLLHEVGVSFSSCGGSVSCAHDDLCWDWSALILGFLFFSSQNKPCQRLHNKVSRIRGKRSLHTDYFAAGSRAARRDTHARGSKVAKCCCGSETSENNWTFQTLSNKSTWQWL